MARQFNRSQLQAALNRQKQALRQYEQKRKRAVQQYNQAVDRYNREVKRVFDDYNRKVRAYNSLVRQNKSRLQQESNKLKRLSQTTTTRYTVYRRSVETTQSAFIRLDTASQSRIFSEGEAHLFELSEGEAANNLQVANALLGDAPAEDEVVNLQDTAIAEELELISPDLGNRWLGAVYALNPRNPDAARHFCASARELMAFIIESKAPDQEVKRTLPHCELTRDGKPTRKAKIQFFLRRKGVVDTELETFIDEDMGNIVELFRIFNEGTHGSAGAFNLRQLATIKKRVEDGIQFLARVIN